MILLACTVLVFAAAPSSQPVGALQDTPISPELKPAYNIALAGANRIDVAGNLREQLRIEANNAEKAHRERLKAADERAGDLLKHAQGRTRSQVLEQRRGSTAIATADRENQEASIAKKAGPAAQLQSAGTSFAQAKVHAEFGQMKKAYAAYRSGLRTFAGAITPLKGSRHIDGSLTGPAQNVATLHGECVESFLKADLAATAAILQACHREIARVDEVARSGGASNYAPYNSGFTGALKAAEGRLANAGFRLDPIDTLTSRPASPATIGSRPAGPGSGG